MKNKIKYIGTVFLMSFASFAGTICAIPLFIGITGIKAIGRFIRRE